MKILVSVAITLASVAAVQSANAADLNIERRSYYSGERTASTVWVWRARRPTFFKYAPNIRLARRCLLLQLPQRARARNFS